MKKKLLSLALALVMCLGLMVPVSAEVLYDNETFDGDIKFTIDSNGTLSLTGTGELNPNSFFDLGRKFIAIMVDNGYHETGADAVTINIASSITIADKDGFEEVCKKLKLFAADISGDIIKTVNINRSSAPASTAAPATPAPAPTPAPAASKFTDVAANSPYKDAINWAVEKGITKGTTATTFGPNQTCTVSHILTFILRYFEGDDPSREHVSEFCKDLALELNIPNLKPDQPCTRALAVQFLYLLYGGGGNQSAAFSDVPSDSGPLSEAVNWAVESGVTKGTSATTFSPNNICTRGQIVTFLYRADKAK